MIGTRSRAPKTTVRGDILLATLATREEEKRRTEAERRAAAKARQAQTTAEEENLLFEEADAPASEKGSGRSEEDAGESGKAAGEGENTADSGRDVAGGGEKAVDKGEEVVGGGENVGESEEIGGEGEEVASGGEGVVGYGKQVVSEGEGEGDSDSLGGSDGEAHAARSAVQDPITLDGNVLRAEKQGRDYLLDSIPAGEGCAAHLKKCFPAIREMDTYEAVGKSKTRRVKEARFLALSRGFVLRPPRPLLRRLLALHNVDVRELDQVVQHCLVVTAGHRYHAGIWLAHLGRWMRQILKSDEEGKAWLSRAVVKLRKQKKQREKKRAKKGKRAHG